MATSRRMHHSGAIFSTSSRRNPVAILVTIALCASCLIVLWHLQLFLAKDNESPLDGFAAFILSEPLVDPQSIRVPEYKCIGWHQTTECNPNGPPDPDMDDVCWMPIEGTASGYCILQDVETGEEVNRLRTTCTTIREDVCFTCNQVAEMAPMATEINKIVAQARWDYREQLRAQLERHRWSIKHPKPSNGIVMVIYPKMLVSVHATVRMLRTYGCTLPVELWYMKSEMGDDAPANTRPILKSLVNEYGPIALRAIDDDRIRGFATKVYALINSDFDQVLFLDADNVPVRDPTYLFTDSKAFRTTGAVFWPDFWHPRNTIFNIHEHSPLWEMVGTPFVDMFEQESGQILVDKRRAKATGALAVLELLAYQEPNHFASLKFLHGDKDLFRLAWMKTNTSFHMVQHPPASAGSKVETEADGVVYCGMTMVQFDPDASVDAGAEAILFMHRNAKKLSGLEDVERDAVWTHLQLFSFPEASMVTAEAQYEHVREHYRIQIGGLADPAALLRSSMCYGDRDLKSSHFTLLETADVTTFNIRKLEATLLRFGREALNESRVISGADAQHL